MAEPTILDIPFPKVRVEDVLRAEGNGGQRPLRQGVLVLYEAVLQEVATLAEPKAIWTEVDIEGAEQSELFLKGGYCLTSRLLSRLAGPAEKLVLFVMTLGGKLDAQISRYQQEGKLTRAFAMDSAGSAAIALGSLTAIGRLERRYQALGWQTSIPLGPGHSYWEKLEDQRTIFRILQPERMGVKLNDTNLMLPRKSVSMVVAVGADLPDSNGKTHCDYCCFRKNCPMNKVISLF